MGSFPGLGRCPGWGNDNSPQYPGLENPMDREAWWATVYSVALSRTWLKRPGKHMSTTVTTKLWRWKYWSICIGSKKEMSIWGYSLLGFNQKLSIRPTGTVGSSSFSEKTQDVYFWPEVRPKGAHTELAGPEVASATLKKGVYVSLTDHPGKRTQFCLDAYLT